MRNPRTTLRVGLLALALLAAGGGGCSPQYRTWTMGEKYRGEATGETSMGHVIRYFSEAERARLVLRACDGKLCDQDGRLLDPDVANRPERGGSLMYVMDEQGVLYGTFDAKLEAVHHSSLLGGAPVACAGDMLVVQGELLEVDNMSGHYKPPAEALDQVVVQLRRLGVDLSHTKVKYYGLPDRAPPPSASD